MHPHQGKIYIKKNNKSKIESNIPSTIEKITLSGNLILLTDKTNSNKIINYKTD